MSGELRALAASSLPGPWFSQPSEHEPPWGVVYGPDGDSFVTIEWNPGNDYDPVATAVYIAAASPDVVLGLLGENDRLREALRRYCWHDIGCPRKRNRLYVPITGECNCGLGALLGGSEA